ncbi:MAG TPA: AzlD domain-containing protein [Chloroflexota bacterium]|nr:AzlD domain-containing protein [Chloroflexota bacterium]
MSELTPILGMAAAVYALRLAGLLLASAAVPPAWERALGFVPVATLTALVVSSLAGRPDEAPARVVAATGAGLAAWRTGRAWVCILVGMAVYWLLRLP